MNVRLLYEDGSEFVRTEYYSEAEWHKAAMSVSGRNTMRSGIVSARSEAEWHKAAMSISGHSTDSFPEAYKT